MKQSTMFLHRHEHFRSHPIHTSESACWFPVLFHPQHMDCSTLSNCGTVCFEYLVACNEITPEHFENDAEATLTETFEYEE